MEYSSDDTSVVDKYTFLYARVFLVSRRISVVMPKKLYFLNPRFLIKSLLWRVLNIRYQHIFRKQSNIFKELLTAWIISVEML